MMDIGVITAEDGCARGAKKGEVEVEVEVEV